MNFMFLSLDYMIYDIYASMNLKIKLYNSISIYIEDALGGET